MDLRTIYKAMTEIEVRLKAEIMQDALEDAKYPENLRAGIDDTKIRYAAAASLMIDYLASEISKAIDAGEIPEDPWIAERRIHYDDNSNA